LKNINDELPIFPEGLPIIENTEDLQKLKLSPDNITISAVHVFEAKDVLSDSRINQKIDLKFNLKLFQ